MPLRLRLLFPFVLVLALGATACGGGGGGSGSSGDAKTLVDTAFKHSIKSANINLNLQAQLQGIQQLNGPLSLKVSGPYESSGQHKLPKFDFSANILGGGQSLPLAARSTGDDVFIQLRGTWYELGKQAVTQINQQLAQQSGQSKSKSLSAFGISPLTWLKDAKKESDTTIGGDKVSHVSATLDVGKVLADLNTVISKANVSGTTKPSQITPAQQAQIQKYVNDPHIDIYVGKSDQTLRRLAATIPITVPKDQQAKVKGLKGGTIQFSIEFTNVGQSFTVSAPSGAQPISALTAQAQSLISPSGPGKAGGSGSSPAPSTGSGSAPSSKQFQDYAKCIQQAGGNNTTALQRCAKILTK
ncbi:MAG: hypothetical protein ACXVRH_07270 [Thermoleophilaceae bacterium]